jgi:monofunctional biosynthetic peptidoglycan transglycosylase
LKLRSGSRALRVAVAAVLVLLLLPYVVAPLYWFGRPVSTPMVWRWLTGARVERIWVPLEAMSPAVPLAVIAAEDAKFCRHHGIDWGELRAAFRQAENFSEMRGASTITQQIAKNLFLWPGRSVVRKVLEFPLALWLDLVLPKRRLLEIYLNIAEWGPNGEFGVEAGARRAFGKSARALSLSEAALLAAMLPDPSRRSAVRPGPALRRLAGRYQTRARAVPQLAECLRLPL